MTQITEAQAQQAVETQWKAVWPTLRPTVPYVFENKKFVEPSPPTPWARIALLGVDALQHTLGVPQNRLYLRQAAVWTWLQVPVDTGTIALMGLVDDVRQVFEGTSFGGIDPAGGGRWERIGSNGRFYEVAIICPVNYYENK